jgi:quercetin dioxygenase-like cupin family protein
VAERVAGNHCCMTLRGGYALEPGGSLERLDMGGGSEFALKVTGEQSNGVVTVLEGVAVWGGPPLHYHESEDEVVVVLDGELQYQVGDERGSVGAGGVLWFPRAVPHAVANLAGSPCRFLTVVTPSGIEDLFRAQRDYIASLSPGTSPDPAALAGLPGAGSRPIVGPPLS